MTNRKKLPDFVPLVSERTRRHFVPHMGNWMKVHALISQQPRNIATVHLILVMLTYELTHQKRMDIALRLYRAAGKMRRDLEEAQLYNYLGA